LHDISLRLSVVKTLAETQTLPCLPVYNAWLDVVAHQARFALKRPKKMLDFGEKLLLK
jgi:hypothetical protein